MGVKEMTDHGRIAAVSSSRDGKGIVSASTQQQTLRRGLGEKRLSQDGRELPSEGFR
jgi:hypothetical protein